jgi:phage baseplate assembly protein W
VDDEITGRGLAFPLRLGVAGLAESAGLARVEQSIHVILGTQVGERVMRPDFGSRLRGLVFAPNTSATADLARFYATESLTRWEPRIDLLEIRVTNDGGRGLLRIEVRYQLRATQTPHTLVHLLPLEGSA